MSDLLPCPCCGGTPRFVTNHGDLYPHKVECSKCGLTGGGSAFQNDGYNANKWNARRYQKPTDGLLASMALRYRHDFGILPASEQRTILAIMRQIHEEVVGKGFYKPEHEDKYLRAIKDE